MGPRGATGRIGIVTDSTACLPSSLLEATADLLRVVPLTVTVGEETFAEGDGLTSAEVARAQSEGIAVSTARPSPARFVEVYDELAAAGCVSVVSVHASSALSSTVDSARLAAAESSIRVEVLDSRTLGMALGYGALDAVARSREGADIDEVRRAAERTLMTSRTAFYVDSLEPLRRGGRIGRAGALLGSALAIKPLLQVEDGAIEPLARVRSSQRAVGRLAQWAMTQAEGMDASARVCAVHALQPSARSQELVTALAQGSDHQVGGVGGGTAQSPDVSSSWWAAGPVEVPLGAVVTAHVGAGALAVVVAEPSGTLPV